MYAIIDIETTGSTLRGNRITEIAIFKHDGYQIVDEYCTLVNPQSEIPFYITALTGIDNGMVYDAPLFEEIAPKVLEMTEDVIFVAHSVNFDFNVIKEEFSRIGVDFQRKKLCTVRLSRKLIPGFRSYSLGKLCNSLNIPLSDRHRARGDAHATVLLFELLLKQQNAAEVFKNFLNPRSKQATLPANLEASIIDQLPEKPGVYYFRDENAKIIYVGKAINIKKRVLQHFYSKSKKESAIRREIYNIDHCETGNELIALLLESAEIKHHYPRHNAAQKRNNKRFGLITYEDRNGILRIAYNDLRLSQNSIAAFDSITSVRIFIEHLCREYQLCPKYTQLMENGNCGSHFSIQNCAGVCENKEAITTYNQRVLEAIDSLTILEETFIIKEKGRHANEDAVVLVKNGGYVGYGYIEKSATINSLEDIEGYILPQKDNEDVQRIIRWYLSDRPEKKYEFPLMTSFG
ncbi:exonuclease domain-containing protein [Sungkyunkwania multivorans]|uniref:Excinuclease cho n=1 Tax=Sungkyunkwania multivorans TaxID=1173618 RepID=A0ABW3CYU2_9FLAO